MSLGVEEEDHVETGPLFLILESSIISFIFTLLGVIFLLYLLYLRTNKGNFEPECA
jgi:hypothetical protein